MIDANHGAPARRGLRLAVALAAALAPQAARAQNVSSNANTVLRPDVREEILGYDPARSVLVYVERTQSVNAAFAHVALIEATANGIPRRIELTTAADLEACRSDGTGGSASAVGAPSPLAGGAAVAARSNGGATTSSACLWVENRVREQISAARARLTPGTVIPVSEAVPSTGCTRVPFASRDFALGPASTRTAHFEVPADGSPSTLTLATGSRRNAAITLPAAAVTAGSVVARAPYNRIADVRDLPGTGHIAVLLRSDACTPENAAVPVLGLLVPSPPPPEEPLVPLAHAEIAEAAVLRALAPRARRTPDGWVEHDGRVTFDNAWVLPNERILVQFTRHNTVSPDPLQLASFALFSNTGGRLRYLTHVVPRVADPVHTGTGQEAFGVDLDHDGRPEVFLRTSHPPDAESGALIAYDDAEVRVVWRGALRLDERPRVIGPQATATHCTPGRESDAIVLRCTVQSFSQGPNPTSTETVRRLRFNGGAVSVTEERR